MRENWELLTKIDAPEDDAPELRDQQFELISDFSPQGDQPQAIDKLTEGLERGNQAQTLLGVTGSGKNLHDGECDSECPVADTRHLTE